MADPETTEKYFKRLSHQNLHTDGIRTLGRTGLSVSSIGFGGYRVHYDSIENARALRYALLNGFNLIDTSSNYTDGGSEMLLGNLVSEMIERDELHREEVVVVSKVGYVQGQNLKLATENEDRGRAFPDMVKYMDGCWHCIHPDFLQDQLSRSLERLNLAAIDVYLLHNPEYFLSHEKKRGEMDSAAAHAVYYNRIQQAFEWLEEKVAEGKIRAYGISSNTFPNPQNEFEFTSLEKVTGIAEYVASNNYFQVIQFPFNLFETGACFEQNQADGTKTVLQLAQEKKFATLVNRPLNAMTGSGMVRLASFRESQRNELHTAFEKSNQALSALEIQFKTHLLEKVSAEVKKEAALQVFSISQQLKDALGMFQNWEHWDHVKQNSVYPQIFSYLDFLNQRLESDSTFREWSQNYSTEVAEFLDIISRHYENQAQSRSVKIVEALDELDPTLSFSDTLSQKTLRILTSTAGVTCVLLGMRRTSYVEDAAAVLKYAALQDAENFLHQFKKTQTL